MQAADEKLIINELGPNIFNEHPCGIYFLVGTYAWLLYIEFCFSIGCYLILA
jgi:hypothetical protein